MKIYLQRYGYLTNNNVEITNDNGFDDVLESAVKKYQKFFKLNVSGILDAETLDLMSKPRCGVADFFTKDNEDEQEHHNLRVNGSHYTLFPNRQRWPVSKYHLTFGFIHQFPREFIAPVARALKSWDSNTMFSFSPAAHWPAADIVLSFERRDHGDGAPFDGLGGILAHASGPNEGRVHFDGDENWSVGVAADRLNLEMVALHELGHVLGLGHSTVKEAIMWPYAGLGEGKVVLHPDDIAGIRDLYK